MTIVVFGATGQLGRHVLTSLRAHGVAPTEVRAVGRNTERLSELAAEGFATARADLDDPPTVRTAVEGADTVLLISASEPGRRLPQHRAVIDAAREAGVERIVYTSLLDAQDTAHVLAPEHKATEALLAESGLTTTILRNGWYTENYAGDFASARERGVIANAAGGARIASAPRADYAEAAAVVLTTDGHAGRIYELAGSYAWTFEEFATAASRVLGSDVEYRALTDDQEKQALLEAGLDEGTASFVVALAADSRHGLLDASGEQLETLIGHPTASLEDQLRTW